MNQKNLKHLMLWHSLATKVVSMKRTKLECQDVPVMAILKEFREMAGVKGRNAHRAAPKITYEYEKHRSAVKIE